MALEKIFYIVTGKGEIPNSEEIFLSKRKAIERLKYYVSNNRLYILVGDEIEFIDTYLFRLKILTMRPQISSVHPSLESLRKDSLWLKYSKRDGELKKRPRSIILKYKINKEM